MSRSSQTLAPVQPPPSFWTPVIALFAHLWHVIWWVWSTVIVGGLLVGMIISFATNGTSGLTDPSTWVVIQPLLAHPLLDRKSTRLNSSHVRISYAVFCLKKKK